MRETRSDLTEPEIARRRPVWAALSELFLDTELDELDRTRIAEVLSRSGYARAEIEAILYDEVYPILIWNLRSAAGVWDGFDQAWLEERILARRRRRFRWPRALRTGHWMIADEWRRIVWFA